ncbi:MAG: uroporphyrinogen decarboxylase family protein [Candidatus Latescibacter sp.]|nr:uroporphyrinogen decarboxylase family protein [Candidatus Latescibacter sp.]
MPAFSDSTKRDLVYSAIAHEPTGLIPYVIFFQPGISLRLAELFQVDRIEKIADNSIEWIGNTFSNSRMEELGILKDGEYIDEWGVYWKGVGETRGQVKTHPLNEPSLDGYTFPAAIPPDVVSQMKNQAKRSSNKYRCAKLGALWEQATFLRGMEELLFDILVNPGFVHDLLDGILDVLMKNLDLYQRELNLDCIWLSDDYGAQKNLLMSPLLWREFIKPRVQQVCDAVHDRGYHFALHSDGAINAVIPDIVDIGVDLLNPLQSECVDVNQIKREYGEYITIWGGYGSQRTIAFGTPDQVRREVHETCDSLGSGGGFILSPGLSIQNDVPVDNAVAFIETAIERERGCFL